MKRRNTKQTTAQALQLAKALTTERSATLKRETTRDGPGLATVGAPSTVQVSGKAYRAQLNWAASKQLPRALQKGYNNGALGSGTKSSSSVSNTAVDDGTHHASSSACRVLCAMPDGSGFWCRGRARPAGGGAAGVLVQVTTPMVEEHQGQVEHALPVTAIRPDFDFSPGVHCCVAHGHLSTAVLHTYTGYTVRCYHVYYVFFDFEMIRMLATFFAKGVAVLAPFSDGLWYPATVAAPPRFNNAQPGGGKLMVVFDAYGDRVPVPINRVIPRESTHEERRLSEAERRAKEAEKSLLLAGSDSSTELRSLGSTSKQVSFALLPFAQGPLLCHSLARPMLIPYTAYVFQLVVTAKVVVTYTLCVCTRR